MAAVLNLSPPEQSFAKRKEAPIIGESPETTTHCVGYDANHNVHSWKKGTRERRRNLDNEIAKSICELVDDDSSEDDDSKEFVRDTRIHYEKKIFCRQLNVT